MLKILQRHPCTRFSKKNKLKTANVLTANYFSNVILINNGNWNFILKELPWEAQLTPYRDATIADVNNDNQPDILLAGNFYPNNIQMGEYDGDYGTVLINNGNGNFSCESIKWLYDKRRSKTYKKDQTAGKGMHLFLQEIMIA